jgi:hypothetical protein
MEQVRRQMPNKEASCETETREGLKESSLLCYHWNATRNYFPGIINVFMETNELFWFLRPNLNKLERLHQTLYASVCNYTNTLALKPLPASTACENVSRAEQSLNSELPGAPGEVRQLSLIRKISLTCWSRFCVTFNRSFQKVTQSCHSNPEWSLHK